MKYDSRPQVSMVITRVALKVNTECHRPPPVAARFQLVNWIQLIFGSLVWKMGRHQFRSPVSG
jgi:hypothetical protein